MKTKIFVKRSIFLLGLLTLLVYFGNPAYGMVSPDTTGQKGQFGITEEITGPSEKAQTPEHAPGEIIIKLKRQKDGISSTQACSEALTADESILSRLKREHKLKGKIEPVFEKLHEQFKAEIKNPKFLNVQRSRLSPKEQKEKAALIKKSGLLPIYIAKIDGNARKVRDSLNNDKDVEYAQLNYSRKAAMVPDDPYYHSSGSWGQHYGDLWGLKPDKLNCEAAWDISEGEGVIVAVIDTGVNYNHEDLADNIWINQGEIPDNGIDDDDNGYVDDARGWDFAYGDNDPADGFGHGTHCAGTIAAAGNDGIGVIGVAPRAVIMPVKGLSDAGSGTDAKLANCVVYAADNGAKVLSNSWGGWGSSPLLTEVFHYARDLGCVAIAAAGNSNADVTYFCPANIDSVIAVAASNQRDEKCSFSNYGALIDVAAPGGGYQGELPDMCNILSTMPDDCVLATGHPSLKVSNGYYRLAGTSMACPHVAGVAALVVRNNPLSPPDEIRSIIQASSDDIGEPGKDDYFGYGRVNAYRASTYVGSISLVISSPEHKDFIHGSEAHIIGSAHISSEENFREYRLYYAPKDDPENATEIYSSTIPVLDDLLGIWDVSQCDDGEYVISLVLYTTDDKEFTQSICITVDNVNQPPEFINLTDKAVPINKPFEFTVKVHDPDDPETPWGQLEFEVENLPPTAQFNPETHIVSWTPSTSDGESYEVTFKVRDQGGSDWVTQTINLSVIPVYIEEIPVCTEYYNQYDPVIYENLIVWQDHRGAPMGLYSDIYLYDISRDEEVQITTNPRAQSEPRIYGDKIIWMDNRQGKRHIYMCTYDSLTGEIGPEVQITDTPFYYDGSPRLHAVYEDKILWSSSHPDNDLYMLDLSSGQRIKINDNTKSDIAPAMYEDKIVWRNMNGGIYMRMYDSSTGELGPEERIIDRKCYYTFAIYGNIIAYTDEEDLFLYLYDLYRDTIIQVTANSAVSPDIYEDRIVWTDSRNRDYDWNYDIYMCTYDSSTGELGPEIQVTSAEDYQVRPSIFKDTIVWQDRRSGDMVNNDIYMARVFFTPKIVSVSPSTVGVGDTFTITGKNFGYDQWDSYVEFANGLSAPIESWSNTEIVCGVPQDAQSGLLKVVNAAGESNGIEITITSLPSNDEIRHNIEVAVRDHAFNFLDRMLHPERYDANFDLNYPLPDGWVTITDELCVRNVPILPDEHFAIVYGKLMAAVSERLGLTPGDDGFVSAFDPNGDGVIDQDDYDLIHIALTEGRSGGLGGLFMEEEARGNDALGQATEPADSHTDNVDTTLQESNILPSMQVSLDQPPTQEPDILPSAQVSIEEPSPRARRRTFGGVSICPVVSSPVVISRGPYIKSIEQTKNAFGRYNIRIEGKGFGSEGLSSEVLFYKEGQEQEDATEARIRSWRGDEIECEAELDAGEYSVEVITRSGKAVEDRFKIRIE